MTADFEQVYRDSVGDDNTHSLTYNPRATVEL